MLNIVNWYREAHHGFVEARRLDGKRGTIVRGMSIERVDDRKTLLDLLGHQTLPSVLAQTDAASSGPGGLRKFDILTSAENRHVRPEVRSGS
jgi:hypothetical protein